jgi:hypothetical protein
LVLGFSLGGGIFGSYKFGQNTAANRQFARSALRSVLVLYRGLLRLQDTLELLRTTESDAQINVLQELVNVQVHVAASAIADWRDVIPEDFADVGQTLEQSQFSSGNAEDVH